MNSKIEEMQRYYAARAPSYDDIYALPERQADLRWLEQFIPRVFTDRRVLDVAAGTGYWTQFLAREAKSVLAVDVNPETLDLLRGRALGEHVSTSVQDAYALEELSGCNAAFVGFWFSHIPTVRRRAFCKALDAALIPGSPVLFVDNLPGTLHEIEHVDEHGDGWQRRSLPGGETYSVLKNFPRPGELLDVLEGLASQTVWRELEHYWVFQYATGLCRA